MVVAQTEEQRLRKLWDDDDFQSRLDDFALRGMARTRLFQSLYRDAVRWMFGDQGPLLKQEGWDYPAINIILPAVWQEIATLSANNPALVGTPFEDTDEQVARHVTMALQAQWNVNLHMQMRTMQALQDGHLAGYYVGFWQWERQRYWNKRSQQYVGDIDFTILNPTYFGCDPDVELSVDIPVKSKYIVIEYYMDKEEAIRRWPLYRKYLIEQGQLDPDNPYAIPSESSSAGQGKGSEGLDYSGFDAESGEGIREKPFTREEFGKRLTNLICGAGPGLAGGKRPGSTTRHVRYQMFLWRDQQTEKVPAGQAPYSLDEIKQGAARPLLYDPRTLSFVDEQRPIQDENGRLVAFDRWPAENPFPRKTVSQAYERPRYPNGHYTIRLDDKLIVDDRAYPYERWPVAVGVNYLLPHLWIGLNSVETGIEMQRYLNILHSHLLNNVKHHSDTQWVVENGALDTPDPAEAAVFIPNASGSVIPVTTGSVNRVRREPPAALPAWIFNLDQTIRERHQDIQGKHNISLGRTSGAETLGENQLLHQNDQGRAKLQEIALHTFMKQVGYGFIELMQAHYGPGRWVRLLGPDPDAVLAAMQWSDDHVDARVDIDIRVKSTLPYDEQAEQAKYLKATELLGPPMFKALLERLGIPNAEDILQQHDLLGPFTALVEQAQAMQIPPEQILQIMQQTIEQLAKQQAVKEQLAQETAA